MKMHESEVNAVERLMGERHTGGYEWREIKSPYIGTPHEGTRAAKALEATATLVLRPVPTADGTVAIAREAPNPQLFLQLAALVPEADAIRAFADHYGWLGIAHRPGAAHVAGAETLGEWRDELAALSDAVAVWHAIQQHRLDGLIQWTKGAHDGKGAAVAYDSSRGARLLNLPEGSTRRMALVASERYRADALKVLKMGDLEGPARLYLETLINERLRGCVAPQVFFERSVIIGTTSGADARLLLIARGNLACAWLQFSEAVAGRRAFRRCEAEGCGKWIVYAPVDQESGRPTRKTCSNMCRMRVYLARKSKAADLRREGMTVRAIAEKLDADIESVKSWIAKRG